MGCLNSTAQIHDSKNPVTPPSQIKILPPMTEFANKHNSAPSPLPFKKREIPQENIEPKLRNSTTVTTLTTTTIESDMDTFDCDSPSTQIYHNNNSIIGVKASHRTTQTGSTDFSTLIQFMNLHSNGANSNYNGRHSSGGNEQSMYSDTPTFMQDFDKENGIIKDQSVINQLMQHVDNNGFPGLNFKSVTNEFPDVKNKKLELAMIKEPS